VITNRDHSCRLYISPDAEEFGCFSGSGAVEGDSWELKSKFGAAPRLPKTEEKKEEKKAAKQITKQD